MTIPPVNSDILFVCLAIYTPPMGQMPREFPWTLMWKHIEYVRFETAYMPPPPPGPYPPPPNGTAAPRPSMPPTPIPAHAHAYYHHQSPQRMQYFPSLTASSWFLIDLVQHAVPYSMMMAPPPAGVPPHPYENGPPPPVQMGGHAWAAQPWKEVFPVYWEGNLRSKRNCFFDFFGVATSWGLGVGIRDQSLGLMGMIVPCWLMNIRDGNHLASFVASGEGLAKKLLLFSFLRSGFPPREIEFEIMLGGLVAWWCISLMPLSYLCFVWPLSLLCVVRYPFTSLSFVFFSSSSLSHLCSFFFFSLCRWVERWMWLCVFFSWWGFQVI